MRYRYKRLYTIRTKTKFLIFPKVLKLELKWHSKYELRWLERAKYIEEYINFRWIATRWSTHDLL